MIGKPRQFLFKKKIYNASVAPAAEASATPAIESESSLTGPATKQSISKTLSRTASLVRVKRFFANTRSKREENLKIQIFSLHGYSSLQVMQHGPKACRQKVSE